MTPTVVALVAYALLSLQAGSRGWVMTRALRPETGRLFALIVAAGMCVLWPAVLIERYAKFERPVAPFGLHGKYLEHVALNCYGLTRSPRRWYWPFRESDRSLRARCVACARKVPSL